MNSLNSLAGAAVIRPGWRCAAAASCGIFDRVVERMKRTGPVEDLDELVDLAMRVTGTR